MFVRLLFAAMLVSRVAHAEQEPSFVLTIDEPVGGKPAQHKVLTDAVRAREAELKPALLAKTASHHASRLKLVLKLEVAADGSIKPAVEAFNYRDAKGEIKDDSIKVAATESLAKTKKVARELKGTKVSVTVAILQP